jgi:hypothetical protein
MTTPARIGGRVAAAGCLAASLVVVFAVLPDYLIGYLRLTREQTAGVLSGAVLGAGAGVLAMPFATRVLGWQRPAAAGVLCAAIAIYAFRHQGPDLVRLFTILAALGFFSAGTLRLLMEPLLARRR